MAQRALPHVTPEQYLAREALADERSEYVDGVVYAMAGSSLNHARMVHALAVTLDRGTEGSGCETFGSETKLGIEAANAYFYPDAMVVCGELEVESETAGIVKNPVVVFEVLSPGTQRYDKGRKFIHYQSVAGLREYVLVSSDRKLVERYERQDDGSWRYTAYVGDVRLPIASLGIDLDLARLYARLVLD